MSRILTETQRHLLRMIFDRGAEGASLALSKWLGKEVCLTVSEVEITELEQAAELLGPADSLVAACSMGLTGRLTGWILLVFEDRSGLALVDMLYAPADRDHDDMGRARAIGRQGDDQHRRLRLCQRPGCAPAHGPLPVERPQCDRR